jgi:hypothetical protein
VVLTAEYEFGDEGDYVGQIFSDGVIPIRVDQFNQEYIPSWGDVLLPDENGHGHGIVQFESVAFDPISGMILVGVSSAPGYFFPGGDPLRASGGVLMLDPVTGKWDLAKSIPLPQVTDWSRISAMAVEPATGDIYYLNGTLRRYDRASGQDLEIGSLPVSPELRFASDRYVQP